MCFVSLRLIGRLELAGVLSCGNGGDFDGVDGWDSGFRRWLVAIPG